ALAAVADQQFALALEQADAVDLDGFGAGGTVTRVVLGGVGRAVRVVRVDDKHRSAPSIRGIDVNDSHLPVKHPCARPSRIRPWSPRSAPSRPRRPVPAPPAPAGSAAAARPGWRRGSRWTRAGCAGTRRSPAAPAPCPAPRPAR